MGCRCLAGFHPGPRFVSTRVWHMIDTSLHSTRTAAEMGEQRLCCTPRPALLYLSCLVAAALGLVGLYLMAGAAWALTVPPADNQDLSATLLGLVAFGFASLVLGVYLLVRLNSYRHWRVLVCDHGLVHEYRGKATLYRWEDIQEIRHATWHTEVQHVLLLEGYRCWITRKTGEQLELFNYYIRHAPECGRAVDEQTFHLLLPPAQSLFAEGSPVAFGRIGVSQEGLSYREATLPWEDVEGIAIRHGVLEVKKKNKWLLWCKEQTSRIPNILVLVALMRERVDVYAE
jgi:hypothetical protein